MRYRAIGNVAAWLILTALFAATPASVNGGSEWVQDSYADFRDGTFTDAGSNAYVSARGRVQIITRWDFNNDGHLDILLPAGHGYDEKSNTFVYLNNGGDIDGRLRIELPSSGSVAGLVRDLNKDGKNDLIVANGANSHWKQTNAYIYWGSSEPLSVQRRTELPAFTSSALAVGDFNRDGLDDLAFACQWQDGGPLNLHGPKSSFVYWNSPNGFSVDRRLPITFADGKPATAIAAGDLDADGTDDLVICSAAQCELFYSSRGAFQDPTRRVSLAIPDVVSAAVGDFNGDHRRDLALCTTDSLVVLPGTDTGYQPAHAIRPPMSKPVGVAVADFDKNGSDDIVVACAGSSDGTASAESVLLLSDGKDLSAARRVVLPTLGASGVSAGDLNGDGFPEIVFSNRSVANYHSLLSYVYWNRSGAFRPSQRTQLATEDPAGSAIGDLNGDGKPDVVFFNFNGGIHDGPALSRLYWGDGTRQFMAERSFTFTTNHIFGFGHADFDDDDWVDLALSQFVTISGVEHQQNGTNIYWGAKDPQRRFLSPTNLSMTRGYGGVRIADINRDGWLDIVAGGDSEDPADSTRSGLTIFWGSSTGFQNARRAVLPLGEKKMIRIPLLMDFNRDGWLDLAGQVIAADGPNLGGPVLIWWGSASGFSADRTSKIDLGGDSQQLMYLQGADFNRDGWLDLLIPNRGGGDTIEKPTWIYYGSKDGFDKAQQETIMGTAPYDNCVADFDKDGWLDIFLCAYGAVEGNEPSLIYWGSKEGFSARPRTELPTYGSSGAEPLDYDGDGWLDVLISNHRQGGFTDRPVPHRHLTQSMLYWGGPAGFSPTNRLDFPTYGPSGMNPRDPGNSYDRGLYEDYVSPAHEVPQGERPTRIEWAAETPHGTAVHVQLRTASTREALDTAAWSGSSGPDSWFTRRGEPVQSSTGGWIQYRARLITPNAAATPSLTKVIIRFDK